MPATDQYAGRDERAMTTPASGAIDANSGKSDTLELSRVTRAIYTGSGGTMKVTMVNGDIVTLASVPAGTMLPLRIRQLWSSVTTVTDCIGFY